MPLPTYYQVGTASIASGGHNVVTFVGALLGTADSPTIQAGDLFLDPAQPSIPPQRIASVDYVGLTATLAVNWPGATMTGAAYEVRFVGDTVRSTAQTRQLLNTLGALANTGVGIDAIGLYSVRSTYDSKPTNFAYLSLDGNESTISAPIIYIKNSVTAGDWSAPITIQGPQGIQGLSGLIGIWRGPWVTSYAYVIDDAVSYNGSSYLCVTAHSSGSDFNADLLAGKWQLMAQKGAGPIWRGAWSSSTTYAVNDVVSDNDAGGNHAAWVALQTGLNQQPKSSPTYWDLFPASFPVVDDWGAWTGPISAADDYGVFH